MFHVEKTGEYEPYKVRRKEKPVANSIKPESADNTAETPPKEDEEDQYEEDFTSEEGAIWPIKAGSIVDWPCFFALINFVYNTINPPFHTPILFIAEPVWTPKEHEKITQFFFEKFKTPAFTIMDSAMATSYAYGLQHATVIDVGFDKADVTAISDFQPHTTGRALSIPDCGGEAMTQQLLSQLGSKGFTRAMCEQLKKNPICEILAPDVDLPQAEQDGPSNPAAAASTGAHGSGAAQQKTITDIPRGPGEGTEVGVEQKETEENDGVLDIASIVTSGKMNEYLEQKEREKAEKAASKKKGADTTSAPKVVKLPNSKRHKNTFSYEDYALHDALKGMKTSDKQIADMQAAMDDGTGKRQTATEAGEDVSHAVTDGSVNGDTAGHIRREIEVGPERLQAARGGILEKLSDAIFRTISSVEEVNRRSELWDSLIIVGNGSKVRGFKDALHATLQTKYLISPSSATMFTSELPSNLSTPLATGMNTPQPQSLHQQPGSHVNSLLLTATTANNPHLNPMTQAMPHLHNTHSSHAQTPTSIKVARIPEYFPEWKEAGYEEAVFLGAQVAARVLFMGDSGANKAYMTRTDYNESGPQGIHEYSV